MEAEREPGVVDRGDGHRLPGLLRSDDPVEIGDRDAIAGGVFVLLGEVVRDPAADPLSPVANALARVGEVTGEPDRDRAPGLLGPPVLAVLAAVVGRADEQVRLGRPGRCRRHPIDRWFGGLGRRPQPPNADQAGDNADNKQPESTGMIHASSLRSMPRAIMNGSGSTA
jgi:hypothetical protein